MAHHTYHPVFQFQCARAAVHEAAQREECHVLCHDADVLMQWDTVRERFHKDWGWVKRWLIEGFARPPSIGDLRQWADVFGTTEARRIGPFLRECGYTPLRNDIDGRACVWQ